MRPNRWADARCAIYDPIFSAAFVACGARNTSASALRLPAGFSLEAIAEIAARASSLRCRTATCSSGPTGATFTSSPMPKAGRRTRRSSPRSTTTARPASHTRAIARDLRRDGASRLGDSVSRRTRRTQVRRIADVRSGPVAPGTDGDVHRTTSVAYTGGLRLRGGRILVQRDDGQRAETLRRKWTRRAPPSR